jgi:hypothetical protein
MNKTHTPDPHAAPHALLDTRIDQRPKKLEGAPTLLAFRRVRDFPIKPSTIPYFL